MHLDTITFKTAKPGPNFLVLGAVHGNEKCGTEAIKRVIGEIHTGKITLTSGTVTFVPICNPRAYEKDVRYIERNLNRFLLPAYNEPEYETELAKELCPLLAKCDVLLDIHSYSAGGPPFVFAGLDDKKGYDLAAALGDVVIMTGWSKAYAASGRPRNEDEATGTTEYARSQGATSITLECGQHKDPNSITIAYNAIHNAFKHLGLVDEQPLAPTRATTTLITMQDVGYRQQGMTFVRAWKHREAVKQGEIIATHEGHEPVKAKLSGYIIMPHATSPVGEEWFYIGTEQELTNVLRPSSGHDQLRQPGAPVT